MSLPSPYSQSFTLPGTSSPPPLPIPPKKYKATGAVTTDAKFRGIDDTICPWSTSLKPTQSRDRRVPVCELIQCRGYEFGYGAPRVHGHHGSLSSQHRRTCKLTSTGSCRSCHYALPGTRRPATESQRRYERNCLIVTLAQLLPGQSKQEGRDSTCRNRDGLCASFP